MLIGQALQTNEPNLSLRVSRFNEILISAAATHISKSKPSKKSKPWMNPHVRAKTRNRNHLCQMVHQNRQEWIDACREANEAFNEAKTESWKTLLQDAMSNSDGPSMWKVNQVLNSTPDANSSNKAMSHNSRTITDIKSKANVFIDHYARVSKFNMSQCDRDTNRQFKKRIKVPSVDDESCSPLLMSELQSVIKKMKGKGTADPDNIPPSFLKPLGPLAHQELLSIFSSSFSLADCPRVWRVATIIPLLKAGKPPSEIVSFCPISLTSCVVKLLERILADRLYYIAETNNMFSQFQASFYKGRTCEDQITRIVLAIEDLNAEKSEVCPFSIWSNDSSWNPTIFIGNQKVREIPTPRLLGVILDKSLTFNAHLKKLTISLASSTYIIRATAHTY